MKSNARSLVRLGHLNGHLTSSAAGIAATSQLNPAVTRSAICEKNLQFSLKLSQSSSFFNTRSVYFNKNEKIFQYDIESIGQNGSTGVKTNRMT
ncbi:hypothetical protein [Labrenzia sp. DG1229]|uniref:hypothetical protein n=1 Tax=Labrenzia sp. DG1229 TaxID=681847 RepID=UPI0012EB0ED9|nr:hypothetical protein [Labrenzia sp. DG1229]